MIFLLRLAGHRQAIARHMPYLETILEDAAGICGVLVTIVIRNTSEKRSGLPWANRICAQAGD